MIQMSYLEQSDITPEESDWLWKQGLNMEDWDYMLMTEEPVSITEDGEGSYYVYNLLRGCCDNEWYQDVEFRGKKRTIGLAYYA